MEDLGAQLKRWSLKIDRLVDKTQMDGVRPRYAVVLYVDELKALHAVAQSKFDEFRAAGQAERTGLRAGMRSAWDDLEAAFKKPMP
jgi:hypothetical protein